MIGQREKLKRGEGVEKKEFKFAKRIANISLKTSFLNTILG